MWAISTLTNLGTLSKAMWIDRNMKLHDPTNTFSPTPHLDADIAKYHANPQDLLAADRQLFHRPISKVLQLKRTNAQNGSAAYAAPINAFLQIASIGGIPYAISSTYQFPLPHSLILTFVLHKLYSNIPHRSCAFQNGPGPGRVSSLTETVNSERRVKVLTL